MPSLKKIKPFIQKQILKNPEFLSCLFWMLEQTEPRSHELKHLLLRNETEPDQMTFEAVKNTDDIFEFNLTLPVKNKEGEKYVLSVPLSKQDDSIKLHHSKASLKSTKTGIVRFVDTEEDAVYTPNDTVYSENRYRSACEELTQIILKNSAAPYAKKGSKFYTDKNVHFTKIKLPDGREAFQTNLLLGAGTEAKVWAAIPISKNNDDGTYTLHYQSPIAYRINKPGIQNEESSTKTGVRFFNIVYGEEIGNCFSSGGKIQMPLLPGMQLLQFIQLLMSNSKIIPNYTTLLELAINLTASWLNCFAKNKVAHNDIKPENIMVDPETGLVLLTDFIFAKNFGEKNCSGSAMYAAPEQFICSPQKERAPCSKATDSFSLGLIIAVLLGYHINQTRSAHIEHAQEQARRAPLNWLRALTEEPDMSEDKKLFDSALLPEPNHQQRLITILLNATAINPETRTPIDKPFLETLQSVHQEVSSVKTCYEPPPITDLFKVAQARLPEDQHFLTVPTMDKLQRNPRHVTMPTP